MVTPRDKESRQPIRGEARSHLAHVKIARFRERGLEWTSAVRDPSASRGPCGGEKQPEKDESDVIPYCMFTLFVHHGSWAINDLLSTTGNYIGHAFMRPLRFLKTTRKILLLGVPVVAG